MKRGGPLRRAPLARRSKKREAQDRARRGVKVSACQVEPKTERDRAALTDIVQAATRLVSTARAPGVAMAKSGEMRSPTLRAFVGVGVPCRLGQTCTATVLHHHPATGHAPVVDLLAFPACTFHHGECHAGHVTDERQSAEVSRWWRFLTKQEPALARASLKEMADG